jgi:two-component system CheB/CheR fusion protein
VGEHASFGDFLERAKRSDGSVSQEACVRKGLHPRTLLRVTATRVNQREPTLLVALENITELCEQAELAALAARELREADVRKDEFLAMLSHELRNPLSPIVTSLHLLDQTQAATPEADKYRAIIKRQVDHLARIVDDLLDVTRIKRGKVQLKRTVLDFATLIGGIVDDHRPAFATRGIDLESRCEPGALFIHADPTRIVQVVTNLLSNARKFTPRHGRGEVALERIGERAALRVSDTGSGIAPEVLPRVFEPFSQAPQTLDRTTGGLGLGLAMVKGLIELHGGSVRIESRGRNQGTQVTLWLPLVQAPSAAAAPPEQHQGGRRRIVVIDDNQDSVEGLQAMLYAQGHDVRTAVDGPSGFDLVKTFSPDLVICDIGLPGMDGYGVARAIRADRATRGVRLVSLSGYARTEDVERASQAGFDEHLAKPIDLGQLSRVIEEAPTTRHEQRAPSIH